MSDRYLPDKAIDALDEAGSRVHISNIHVPLDIIELEHKIEDVREMKRKAIMEQKFEEAGQYRDEERRYLDKLENAKKHWEEESMIHRELVT